MTFAQWRNHLTTHFSERIPIVKRRMTVLVDLVRIQICWCRNCQTVKWLKHSAALILLLLVWGCWAVSSRFLYSSLVWGLYVRAFAKLWKQLPASSCLSLCPHPPSWLPLDRFLWNLSIFRKSFKKIQVSLKLDKNYGYFTWRPIYIFDHILLLSSS